MSTDQKDSTFEARYRSALEGYLEPTAEETQLIAALELGRTALAEEIGLLDLLAIHHASQESLIHMAPAQCRPPTASGRSQRQSKWPSEIGATLPRASARYASRPA
jgi:hypothetical protein